LNSGGREDFEKGKMDELMRIKYFDRNDGSNIEYNCLNGIRIPKVSC
jgi:hypothetical protein